MLYLHFAMIHLFCFSFILIYVSWLCVGYFRWTEVFIFHWYLAWFTLWWLLSDIRIFEWWIFWVVNSMVRIIFVLIDFSIFCRVSFSGWPNFHLTISIWERELWRKWGYERLFSNCSSSERRIYRNIGSWGIRWVLDWIMVRRSWSDCRE